MTTPIKDSFYSLIPHFQETKNLESLIDCSLHKFQVDEKLNDFSTLAFEWMSKNHRFLIDKTAQEKGEIFLDWYRDHFFSWIQKSESYKQLRSKIYDKIISSFSSVNTDKIDAELEKFVISQVKKHSLYVEIALERVLKENINLHSLPDNYIKRSLQDISTENIFIS